MPESLIPHLAEWLVRASLVFAVAWLATFVFARASAALRAGVWRAAFACAAALPVAAAIAPPLAWLPATRTAAEVEAAPAQRLDLAAAAPMASIDAVGEGDVRRSSDAARPAPPPSRASATPRVDSTLLLAWGWALGASLALFGLVRGLGRATRIVREARPASVGDGAGAEGARVVVSDAPEAPFVLDARPFARPVLVLSSADADDPQRDVELHEGQHLARRDGAWFLFARVVAALAWPTPFAWFALRRLRRESERACDDAVLRGGVRASDYAANLVGRAPARALPVPAMAAGGGALAERVEAICARSADRRALGVRGRAAVALVASGLVVPLATVTRAAAAPQDADREAPAQTLDAQRSAAWASGLAALARMQDPETGAWKGDVGFKLNHTWRVMAEDVPHVGVTALAVEALVLAGQKPGEGPYGQALERAVAWLLSVQDEDGFIREHGTRMREHAHALGALSLACAAGADVATGALERGAAWSVQGVGPDGAFRFTPQAVSGDVLETAHQIVGLDQAMLGVSRQLPPAAFREWHLSQEECLERAITFILDQRVSAEESAPAGAFRYQRSERSRVTDNTTAAGLLAQAMRGLDGWSESLAAFEELRKRSSIPADERDGHFLTWDAELLAGRATGGPYQGRVRGEKDADGSMDEFRQKQVERVLSRVAPGGHWPCTEGPGDAYTTAIACILLGGN